MKRFQRRNFGTVTAVFVTDRAMKIGQGGGGILCDLHGMTRNSQRSTVALLLVLEALPSNAHHPLPSNRYHPANAV